MVERAGLQVQGLCRFSYPCTGGFKKHLGSLAERRAALYDPVRLDQRMLWFERIGLPGVAAQTDPDFTVHLITGEDLPQPWRDRLEAAIAPVPQIAAQFLPPMDHREACRTVLHDGRDLSRAQVAEFRLDDDDAIAVDYVASLRRHHRKMMRVAGPNARVALDQGRGIVIQAAPDGGISLHPLLTFCWSAGLAIYMNAEDEGIVMDFPHHKVWQRMPFVNLTDQVMFVRGDHATNDARTPFAGAGRVAHDPASLPRVLRRRFGIDIDAFADRWRSAFGR